MVVLWSLVRFMLGAESRVVAVVVLWRFGGVVAAARVVVVVGTPGRGSPVRNIATGVQLSHHVDGAPCVAVTIYRATIGIAVNREAVDIVAGSSPCHRGGDGCVSCAV